MKTSRISWNALPSSTYRLLKKTLLHPLNPRRAETTPFPGFVLGSSTSSTCQGEKSRSRPAQGWAGGVEKSRSRSAQGWVGEIVGYASCFSPAAQGEKARLAPLGWVGCEVGLFEQPNTILITPLTA